MHACSPAEHFLPHLCGTNDTYVWRHKVSDVFSQVTLQWVTLIAAFYIRWYVVRFILSFYMKWYVVKFILSFYIKWYVECIVLAFISNDTSQLFLCIIYIEWYVVIISLYHLYQWYVVSITLYHLHWDVGTDTECVSAYMRGQCSCTKREITTAV